MELCNRHLQQFKFKSLLYSSNSKDQRIRNTRMYWCKTEPKRIIGEGGPLETSFTSFTQDNVFKRLQSYFQR